MGASGGPDSMALLYLLHREGIEAVAVHCNYQLRGENSDRDQQLVEEIAFHWGMESVSLKPDPEGSKSGNFQQWARDERYRIFSELKQEMGASLILTAHHEEDQAETILQKMLRGGGLSSWQGMKVLDKDLFRPLLHCTKSEIMQFVQEQHIPYRIDSSNEESTYARNFIRNNWFPEMNKLFPGWKKNLLRVTERAREFQGLTDIVLSNMKEGKGRLNRTRFLSLNSDLRRVIFHRFLETEYRGMDMSRSFLEQLNRLETLQTGGSVSLTTGVRLVRDRDHFVIDKTRDANDEHYLISREELSDGFHAGQIHLSLKPFQQELDEGNLSLDLSRLSFPLTLRRWINGDSFQPFGMKGTQKVSDHLTNRKVPSPKKKEAFVLLSFDGTISAVIFPYSEDGTLTGTISELYRCTSSTSHILTIQTD